MSVVLVESDHRLPLVAVSVVFRAGGVHDPRGSEGLARVTARMLRRGCRGLTAQQLEHRVDELGSVLSTQVGLGTSVVGFECLARSTEPMVDLLRQVLIEPSFDPEELQRLLRQSEAEIVDSRNDDALLASRAMRRNMFPGHPHGRRVGGTASSIRKLTPEQVVAFASQHYTRNNAIVIVCGDVNEQQGHEIARQLLAQLPEGARTPYPVSEPEPLVGRQLVIVDKPDRTQTQMGIGTLGTHIRDDDHTALLVANTAFGGSFTSRMMQEVRSKRGWSYGASSMLATGWVRETFAMWTAPAAEDTAACLKLELELLEQWCQEGISSDELEFCQGYLRRSYPFEIDTPKKRLLQKLESVLLELPDDYHANYLERVDAVSQDAANAAIRRRIAPDRLCISLVATESAIGEAVRRTIPNLHAHKVAPADYE